MGRIMPQLCVLRCVSPPVDCRVEKSAAKADDFRDRQEHGRRSKKRPENNFVENLRKGVHMKVVTALFGLFPVLAWAGPFDGTWIGRVEDSTVTGKPDTFLVANGE